MFQPTTTPDINENSLPLAIAATGIIARDPDTTADLVISIDWDTSFGTKAGQRAADLTYRELVCSQKVILIFNLI